MAGKLVLAVGGSPQFLCTWVVPEDCVSVPTTWWLASPRASYPRGQDRSCPAQSHIVPPVLCSWSHGAALVHHVKGLPQGMGTRKQGHGGGGGYLGDWPPNKATGTQ